MMDTWLQHKQFLSQAVTLKNPTDPLILFTPSAAAAMPEAPV